MPLWLSCFPSKLIVEEIIINLKKNRHLPFMILNGFYDLVAAWGCSRGYTSGMGFSTGELKCRSGD